jgi:hypothetical protein
VTTRGRTADELRIAERYLRVLDDVSRCAQAVRDGHWHNLADTADDLSRRAAQLAGAAAELHDPSSQPRAHVVVDIVASHNGDSEAARLLHPVRPGATGKTTAVADPFRHPGQPTGG